ncbi:7613_t:CDS:2 [Racocetra fulgida]|uniref:7613_t:CDS:1 n=1 Tax=Racocetra fulgida TaxID=60492 RepID=A0A9N9J0H4_9GLOM|nr:7613_t:CDS:2 [Racocetra fulgida]
MRTTRKITKDLWRIILDRNTWNIEEEEGNDLGSPLIPQKKKTNSTLDL